MYKYYWLIAGFLVGVMSVVLGYFNYNLLVQNDTLSLIGSIEVIAEYTIVIFFLSLMQGFFKKDNS